MPLAGPPGRPPDGCPPAGGAVRVPVVDVRGICFAYDHERVIEDISFAIHAGDFLGIIGPNGSGKTTLLRILVGLLRPSCGEVLLFGTSIGRFNEWRRIGYVPQRVTAFDPRFPATVREVVSSGRVARTGLLRVPGKEDRLAVERAMETVGVAQFGARMIGHLSTGQQQRAFIARALVSEPELLILDEPLVGVDAGAQERFYELLRYLHRDLGVTLVMISHDVGVIASEVTTLACMNRTLVYHGDPRAFLESDALRAVYHTGVRVVSHVH